MDSFITVTLVGVDSSVASGTEEINPRYIERIYPADANDIVKFSTALSVIKVRRLVNLQEVPVKVYSSSTVAAVKALVAAAAVGTIAKGQTTLVAGTKAITIAGLVSTNDAFTGLVAQGGTSTGVYEYKAVCTTNTLTISAVDATGALVNTDTSVVNYFVV